MKKLLFAALTIISISFFSNASAQDYKPFKFGVGMLYAIPTGEGAGGGIGYYIEPKYNLNNNLDLGFLVEGALLAQKLEGASGSISGVTSYSITGDYMFGSGKIRPFVGTGIGFYSLGSVDFGGTYDFGDGNSLTMDNTKVELGTKFGISPRIGINLSHFQIELQYHLITGQIDGSNKNYLGLKFGVEFGGGLKK